MIELTWPGKGAPRTPAPPVPLHATDQFPGTLPAGEDAWRNRLLPGDNLPLMEALLPELAGRVDLVYLDPPFLAGREFRAEVRLGEGGPLLPLPAYRDVWAPETYLEMLRDRFLLVRELLSETGSLFVHVNWRVGHWVQALLDEVFGPGERRGEGRPGFRNEIVWGYGGGGAARDAYRRKHDNLFWYTKGDRWTFHPQYRPYTEGTRQRGLTAVKGPRYALREEGATLETWWTDPEVQKILSPTAAENRKYPTQKPETLLERIVLGHSDPGDLVADFFAGSGTLAAVADRLGRRWVAADSSPVALWTMIRRLAPAQPNRDVQGNARPGFDVWRTAPLSPAPPGRVRLERVPQPGGQCRVRLAEYRPVLPEGVPNAVRERMARGDGRELVAYWAADTAARGGPFHHGWWSSRSPRGLGLETETPALTPGPARVKVVDLFGTETLVEDVG